MFVVLFERKSTDQTQIKTANDKQSNAVLTNQLDRYKLFLETGVCYNPEAVL
jgi:hypothetical protein